MMMPAPLWKRIAAFFIDLLIMGLVVVSQFEHFFPKDVHRFSKKLTTGAETATIIIFLLIMAYFVTLEWLVGQTVGKLVVSIRVVSQKGRVSLWQAVVRNMMFIPMFPFMLLWLIDPLFVLFSASRRRLSEMLSSTAVVRA